MKKFLTLFLSMIFCISVFFSGMGAAEAFAMDVDDSAVFLTQAGSDTCTLCSTTMMLRRRAILNGDEQWAQITEDSVAGYGWTWEGLLWDFTYDGMHVVRGDFGGSHEERVSYLKSLLDSHPEGIALYNGDSPHAVLATDYMGDIFFCVDPVDGAERGKIGLDQSYEVNVDNATSFWYIQ